MEFILLHIILVVVQVAIVLKVKNELIFTLIDKLDYKKLDKRDILSSDVMLLYIKALEVPSRFSCDQHTLNIEGEKIKIWAANNINSRAFYTHDISLVDKVKEMNTKLTKYDKLLLDKICNRVKEGELHLINTFFEA